MLSGRTPRPVTSARKPFDAQSAQMVPPGGLVAARDVAVMHHQPAARPWPHAALLLEPVLHLVVHRVALQLHGIAAAPGLDDPVLAQQTRQRHPHAGRAEPHDLARARERLHGHGRLGMGISFFLKHQGRSRMPKSFIRTEIDGAVCTIVLDRPSVRNAVDGPTAAALARPSQPSRPTQPAGGGAVGRRRPLLRRRRSERGRRPGSRNELDRQVGGTARWGPRAWRSPSR